MFVTLNLVGFNFTEKENRVQTLRSYLKSFFFIENKFQIIHEYGVKYEINYFFICGKNPGC